ncbi:16S rRNA (cytosine(1402)-N(4))-methyltransferase RsmH [Ameyamaea chiangmaiensis]|nr:16S rRNA (cytosine(1402)-N(4))-methyltransferase RsmH [Ameyamaea chiangmaiensis]MBS4074383.1 16S rRNA (cytosine(1402)-N(4))-methyltransferase RsmH [Ameyamaea chiangmaiensis]
MAADARSPLDTAADGHVPVMMGEVLESLAPRAGGLYVDGTFGGGGYTRAILAAAHCGVRAIDRDPDAVARGVALADALAGHEGERRLEILQGPFGTLSDLLHDAGVSAVDGIVFDLGVSSFQLDEAERGFSFRADGPLDMRMGRDGPSAADVVNHVSEAELADIFYHYGEERKARRVASAIVAARGESPITTTAQLAAIIRRVVPGDRSGIDPATRSFQGLRIHVNDELAQIEQAIAQSLDLLAPGGRLVVVSFHSLEDRIIKRAMQGATGRVPGPSRHAPGAMTSASARPEFSLLTSRAVRPTQDEARRNPRSRSARLRALERHAPAARPVVPAPEYRS